eukprot:gene10806-biopygen2178
MLDSFKQYLLFYLMCRQLKKTVDTNHKLAEQNKATEMRHMIANVAHDLKTPLSSFMTGIDLIAADVYDLAQKLGTTSSILQQTEQESDLSLAELVSFTSGLQSCITNIRNTNTFMLMTINRCLDYTKASNGLKLVPKCETIDLAEALMMPLQCLRILLAEDTPSVAKITSMMLRRQKHHTAVAENGQIALEMLYKSETEVEKMFDVVLMDLQMPVMDGLEATRRIRAHEREVENKRGSANHNLPHLVVIGVSANSDHETMEEALKAGIDDFLPKPFSMDAFKEVVKRSREKYYTPQMIPLFS